MNENFTAQRISKTATVLVNGKIENVFPLFGAFEERKWADGWNPTLIYPSTEIMMEGTTFKTSGHGHGHNNKSEAEFLWRVSKFEPEKYLTQYLVSTENRYWTITVICSPSGNSTRAGITYTYIGLNNEGNALNATALEKMYARDLKDWEKAINYFLETGQVLKED